MPIRQVRFVCGIEQIISTLKAIMGPAISLVAVILLILQNSRVFKRLKSLSFGGNVAKRTITFVIVLVGILAFILTLPIDKGIKVQIGGMSETTSWNYRNSLFVDNRYHPGGMAVVMSNGKADSKRMQTASPHTTYRDIPGHIRETVANDKDGKGDFPPQAGSVSVWVPAKE